MQALFDRYCRGNAHMAYQLPLNYRYYLLSILFGTGGAGALPGCPDPPGALLLFNQGIDLYTLPLGSGWSNNYLSQPDDDSLPQLEDMAPHLSLPG